MKRLVINYTQKEIREDEPRAERRRYFAIRYTFGSFYVYKPYRGYCEEDALDEFADYAIKHAPGYLPSEERIQELINDAIKAGHLPDGNGNEEIYVHDFYIRAGNCGDWLDLPTMIEEIDQEQFEKEIRE